MFLGANATGCNLKTRKLKADLSSDSIPVENGVS